MATAIPANQTVFSQDELVQATSAHVCGNSSRASCVGVTTDSRGNVEGKLFVALPGERFDGHDYVADVLARGAYAALVERPVPDCEGKLLYTVSSTLKALGSLARAHRVRWGGRVVTIGGSAGKTTTRSAVQTFLSALLPGKVHGTVGNLNNLVGVPLSLLAIEPQHEVAVIEVGTNQRGEIEQLSACCRANVALLTCIGLEHTEGLGDLDGIEAEERALFTHLAAGAKVIGLADDPRVLRLVTEADVERRLTYGVTECASHRIVNRRSLGRERSELSVHRHIDSHSEVIRLVTRLCGLPGALASAAAVCVSDALNVPLDPDVALTALDQKVGEQGRLRVVERSDRALIIDDCYNANPISMRSSFQVAYELAQTEGRRLFFVLGDMRELGAHSQREHVALAEAITGVAAVVAVGTEMSAFVARAKALGQNVSHFDDADAAKGHVCAQIGPGDVVLVKGSRGVQLERVVAALTGGEGHAS